MKGNRVGRILEGVFLLLIVFGRQGFAQISPGELSKSHAQLDGISNCTKCHVLGEKETTSKCLECHKEIRNLINFKKGYHASPEAKDKKCASCHGEHFGKEFILIKLDTSSFNHKLSGFELIGKHQRIGCSQCHEKKLITNNISQKKGFTYLGLGSTCLSCHEDYHQKTLSENCISCHNQDSFRPAPLFKHETTKYPLTGKHKSVDCAKCHKTEIRNGKKFQIFADVKFSNCTSCHEDVHKNKFGNDCTKCHSEDSFHSVSGLNSFDHSKTNYPLEGKHKLVACAKCHKGSYTNPVRYNLCSDCHTDYHKNQFLKNGKKPDCSQCHSIENFTTTSYTIEKHNLSDFKLEGSHQATPCFLCHKKSEKWVFTNLGKQCNDCHKNIHEDRFDEKYLGNGNCANCHSVISWNQINFNHNTTNFSLTGKHVKISCRKCHFTEQEGLAVQKFKGLNQECSSCHADIHFKQFQENNNTDCTRCHSTDNWKPDKFNHDNSRFKLDGSHIKVDCKKCHKPGTEAEGNYIFYRFRDISCASCHHS